MPIIIPRAIARIAIVLSVLPMGFRGCLSETKQSVETFVKLYNGGVEHVVLKIAIMAQDRPVEENVLLARPGPDIVDDQRSPRHSRFDITNEPGVGVTAAQVPGDHISGLIVGGIAGDGEGLALAIEEAHQIRNAAVIDVWVRAG